MPEFHRRPKPGPARRRRTIPCLAAVVVGALAGAVTMVPTPAVAATGTSAAPTGHVVVVLKDQLTATPAAGPNRARRASATMKEQQAVLATLPGSRSAHVAHFSVGNAFAITATPAQSAALATNPAVAEVIADAPVDSDPDSGYLRVRGQANHPAAGAATPICPSTPAHPLLEPEALGLIHAPVASRSAAQQQITGAGVRVGYIADGIDPDNPDLIRPNGQHVITDYQDFTGEGTAGKGTLGEAFGDASSIAAQGTVVHDLHDYDPSIPVGCTVRVVGVAPGASVVALKGIGGSSLSDVLQSIDYAVNVAHVDVLNESFGLYPLPNVSERDAVALFNDAAVAAGVTVVVSSGDAGVTNTIATPAADPHVISVGATTSLRIKAQLGVTGTNGRWADNNIANFSSSGVTSEGRTVDLVAPGFGGWSACTPSFGGCGNAQGDPSNIVPFAGTSESAPFTSGVAALVIQSYRQTHAGASPTPALVKQLITSTAGDLGANPQDQGAGLLNAKAAIDAARAYHAGLLGGSASASSNLVLSTDQLDLTGAPGAARHAVVVATNAGRAPLRVTPVMRRFVPLSSATQQVGESADTTPAAVPITVPAGADQLVVQALAPGSLGDSYVLRAPDGTLENISIGGFSSTVRLSANHPKPGTWTLLPPTGLTGTLTVRTDTLRAVSVGRVQPGSFTLPGGASRTVSVGLTVPADSGDHGYEVNFAASSGNTTTVPVIVRSLVPIVSGHGTFAGTLTSGSGRVAAPPQTFTYAFDVPSGTPNLTVSTALGSAAETDQLAAVLIAPNGETPSITTNAGEQPGTLQTVPHPVPGRWRLVLVLEGVPQNLSETFTGTIGFTAAASVTATLPDSDTTTLPSGTPTTVPVTITNPGSLPLSVSIDPRTTVTQPLPLIPLNYLLTGTSASLQPTSDTVKMPLPTPVELLVPPGTSSLSATSTSAVPTQVELTSPTRGVDVFGSLRAAQAGGTTSTATVTEPGSSVGDGVWAVVPQQIGPFGTGPAPSASATLTASALAPGFDRTMTSPDTTDQFLVGIDPDAPAVRSVSVAPGGSATIRIAITPTGAPGTQVRGVLNLVTPVTVAADLSDLLGGIDTTTGDVVAALPYSYTVGSDSQR